MKKLNPEVSKIFNLITIRPGYYNFPNFGPIDLTTIPLAKAQELFDNGFPFLKLKNISSPQISKPEHKSINIPDDNINDLDKLRENKRYINKLLTLNYSDLSFQEKAIFYNDERFFFDKKNMLHDISKVDTQMKSLHAKMKLTKKTDDRKHIVKDLLYLESLKTNAFSVIDAWQHQESIQESVLEKAAREAVEKANEIKNLTNYIGRFERIVAFMPDTTETQQNKKTKKLTEIAKRRQRLIGLNAPYNRQIRK
jgi:hypothetical protein